MPKVPVYHNSQAHSEVPGASSAHHLSGVRPAKNEHALYAEILAAKSERRAATHKFFETILDQVDEARVQEAVSQLQEERGRLTISEKDGFQSLRSKNALELPEKRPLHDVWGEKLDKKRQEILAGLGTPRQKRSFDLAAKKIDSDFKSSITHHVAKEFASYQSEVKKHALELAVHQMGQDIRSPADILNARSRVVFAVEDMAKLLGWSDEKKQVETISALSSGHENVLTQILDEGNLEYAAQYVETYQNELDRNTKLKVSQMLQKGASIEQEQELTQRFMQRTNGDAQAAVKMARSELSGAMEDAVVSRLLEQATQEHVFSERAQKQAADHAWRIYSQTKKISSVPLSVLMSMDGKAMEALRQTAIKDAEALLTQREVKTDYSVYERLSRMQHETPDEFRRLDIRKYFPSLSPGDRRHFIDAQASSRMPDAANSVVTVSEQKRHMLEKLGLKGKDAGAFLQQADRALMASQLDKGTQPLTAAERQKVLDTLVMDVAVPGKVWGENKKKLYEVRESGESFSPRYTEAQKQEAKNVLIRNGWVGTPSEADVIEFLNRKSGLIK